jgi:hypothetical protein
LQRAVAAGSEESQGTRRFIYTKSDREADGIINNAERIVDAA